MRIPAIARIPVVAFAFALGLAPISCGRVLAQAGGEAAPPHATVVRIDGEDVYLDIGIDQLAGARTLTVYRRVSVRHPLTRKTLEDRFAIGELAIVQPGAALSLARAAAAPSHPFAVGDRAEGPVAPPSTPAAPARADAAAPASAEPTTTETAVASTPTAAATVTITNTASAAPQLESIELLRYYHATLGQPPERRVRLYAAYLEQNPRSSYRSLVEQEMRYLRALSAVESDRARSVDERRRAALLASAIELLPPSEVPRERALLLAARVRPEADVRGLLLHVRGPGEDVYRTLPFALDGRGHARVTIPAELVGPPQLAFFVEAVNRRGEVQSAFASARKPHVVSVPKPPEPAEARRDPAMRVRWSSEVASFDGTSGRDYFLIHEGDFFYRLHQSYLRGIRMGYGRFDGEGGTVAELDEQQLDPRPAGFTYAFVEGELALTELVGLSLRGTLGLGRPEESDDSEITGGFQTRLRIGDPNRTNLVIGGELLPEIGQRALLALGWELIDRVPMAAEVQVTDQPVNSDELAVRIVYELGYRVTDRIALALRPSYQLRTIRHAGPGLGLSATFDW